jgi:hypothetical protein
LASIGLDDLAVRDGPQVPNSPSSTGLHELVGDPDRVVGVLVLDGVMSLPSRSMSKPASRRARILSSSRTLVSMNSSMSGWSTSRTTIFAARRVLPPDLMVPAEASAPRMKLTGPEAVPPEESSSLLDERMRDRLSRRRSRP